MFCPNCGTQLPDDMKFCTNCGTQVAVANQPQGQTASQSAAPSSQPQASSSVKSQQADSSKVWKTVGKVLLVLLVAGFLRELLVRVLGL